jgi:hypothetical protein
MVVESTVELEFTRIAAVKYNMISDFKNEDIVLLICCCICVYSAKFYKNNTHIISHTRRKRGSLSAFKASLHYQSFCDHSQSNFAWMNSAMF